MIEITKLKNNPNNPRTIKKEQLEKLKRSIQSFPEMMEKRPMVCVTDTDGKIFPLGGNMRLKAIKELGFTEIKKEWITLADEWTEEQRKEFVIKDNASLGDWNFDELVDAWDVGDLEEWGVDVPEWLKLDEEDLSDDFSLADGDREPFQQMTFTLADEQAEQIKNAISDIKQTEEYKYCETFGNENSNGNALYLIVMKWAEAQKI